MDDRLRRLSIGSEKHHISSHSEGGLSHPTRDNTTSKASLSAVWNGIGRVLKMDRLF
jgi:hypothetical protein